MMVQPVCSLKAKWKQEVMVFSPDEIESASNTIASVLGTGWLWTSVAALIGVLSKKVPLINWRLN